MDFSQLLDCFTFVVLLACLTVGYLIKTSFDCIPNKYIPTILAGLGCVLNLLVCGFTIESAVYGAVTGLASTGLHQAFTQFISNPTKPEE